MSEDAMETPTTELKTQGGGEVSTGNATSEAFDQTMHDIWEGMSQNKEAGDFTVSRVTIMQPGSPEISGDVQGYNAGQLIDNLTRLPLSFKMKPPWLHGKVPDDQLQDLEVMSILPVYRLPDEYIQWIPKTEQVAGEDPWIFKTLDKGEQRVRDGSWPPIGTFKGEGSPPVTRNMNFCCIVIDPQTLAGLTNFVVLTFSRTSFSSGKTLHGFLEGHRMRKLLPWEIMYYVTTERKPYPQTNSFYYVMNVKAGPVLLKTKKPERTYHEDLIDVDMMSLADGMGRWLHSDRVNQELMINAAAFSNEEGPDQGPTGGTSSPPAADDPFADPVEEGVAAAADDPDDF